VIKPFIMKSARSLLFLMPTLALAMPTLAQDRPSTLSDSQEPGSVIVFPKFVKGTVSVNGVSTPRTEIEVSVDCPNGVICPQDEPVKIHFHWVCPAVEGVNSQICRENDFDVTTTVHGTVVFGPDGIPIPGSAAVTPGTPPAALCPGGYLIGWVISPTNDQPIKFDGLIGDAVIRQSSTAVGAYDAIPIQADPNLATGALITTSTDPLTGIPSLVFDGGAGHYLAVPGSVKGIVKYDNLTGAAPLNQTFLTLLTLDVRSGQPNFPTNVFLNFFTAGEVGLSTSLEFVCWTEVSLSDIDSNLNQATMGRKGQFLSGQAVKFPINGIFDTAGPVTLLGLVETTEGATSATIASRSYFTGVFNNSIPVPTIFLPD
jgi:hypothetical protein